MTLTVDTLMQGRRTEAFEVRMSQGDKPVLVAMVRTAAAAPGLVHDVVTAPAVCSPEDAPDVANLRPAGGPPPPRFFDNLDVRVLVPERFAIPRPTLPPTFLEWYRFRSADSHADPFVDAARSLVLIDTLCWPATVMAHPNPAFFAPSLDVGVWFHRSAPDEDWLLAEATSEVADGGTIGGRARVFSRAGKLLASGGTGLLCMPSG